MYVYQAIKRTKENDNIEGPRAIREVLYAHQSEDQVIAKLKNACKLHPGTWRIYRSVNKRDEHKAKLELVKTLIDQLTTQDIGAVTDKNPESLWKTILMQPRNKAERLFLLDVDHADIAYLNAVIDPLGRTVVVHLVKTPNGFHVICNPFNPAMLEGFEYVSLKKDALVFIESFET